MDHEKMAGSIISDKYDGQNGRLQGEGSWEKLPLFWFILFLSYRCTRRCGYCYTFNQVGGGNRTEMDASGFSRLLEWIPEVWRANNAKVNVISFLGGEPLLRTDRIKKVMGTVRKHTDGVKGLVTTNGDLVDKVDWNDLQEIKWITINITDSSLEELGRRMRIIGNRSNVSNQTIAATLDDQNLDRILDITRFGIEHGYRLRYNRNIHRGRDGEYKSRLLRQYHALCDLLENYAARGYDVHTTFLLDTLIPSWDQASSPYLCGRSIAAVFPDSTIGPCLRNHSFKTGTLFDADPLKRLQCDTYHFSADKPDIPDECRTCGVKAACQGGCPYDKLLFKGTRSGKSVLCDVHKEIIPRLKYLDKIKTEAQRGTSPAVSAGRGHGSSA